MTPSLNCGPLRQEWLKNTLHQMKFAHGSLEFYSAYWKYLHRFLFSGGTAEWYFYREDGTCQTPNESDENWPLEVHLCIQLPGPVRLTLGTLTNFHKAGIRLHSCLDGSRYIICTQQKTELKQQVLWMLVSAELSNNILGGMTRPAAFSCLYALRSWVILGLHYSN